MHQIYSVIQYLVNSRKFAGRTLKWHGLNATCMRRVEEPVSAYPLRIIGDGPERERLVTLAAEWSAGDAVSFHGSVHLEEIMNQLRPEDAFEQHWPVGHDGLKKWSEASMSEANV